MLNILYILIAISVLLLVGLIIFCIYAISLSIYRRRLRYETFPSTAEICDKRYMAAYTSTTMITVGKVMVPQTHYHDEEYNVYLMYEGKRHCIDDEEFYDLVNVGDIVRVLVHKGYNKHNEMKHVYLSIED